MQCRKAAVQLSECLRKWSTFVLLDNTTYIKFIYHEEDEEKVIPKTFYIIRMTSKPPCVIIWLAFPGGTSGSIRNKVVLEVTELISQLTIKQLQLWKDPTHHHEPHHGIPNQGEALSGDLSESPACILFNKPVERIMIRYDHQPSDFLNVMEPAFDSLNTNGQKLTRRFVNVFGGICHERPSSGTYLTLSRYLHHRRWLWTVQHNNSPILVPEASITRILTTLLRVRQMEGFTFAHSKNGIQTLMLELPIYMNGQDDHQPVTCVVQYVIFPPHSSAGSSNMSTWSEENSEDGSDVLSSLKETEAEEEEDEETLQIITELWVEPQEGVVMNEGHNWNEAVGMTYDCLPKIIFPKDNEIISCLLTCEYLSLMCQKTEALSPSEMAAKINQQQQRFQMPDLQRVNESEEMPKLGSDIQVMPVQWNLTMVLSKSQPVELLCPMFIQNLNSQSGSAESSSHYDKSNEDLYREILEKIANLHDREVNLLESDHEEFTNYLAKVGKDRKLKFPSKDHMQPLRPRMSLSKRWSKAESIKWVCFVKGITHSRTLVTMLPRSYTELKSLLVEESNLAGNNPVAVNIVQKPIVALPPKHQPILPVFTPDDSQCSSELINSTNSSLSNLDMSEQELRLKSGSISNRPRKRSSITTPTPKEEFRKRVFSSDSVQAADRNRCRSFDTEQACQQANPSRNSGDRGGGGGGHAQLASRYI